MDKIKAVLYWVPHDNIRYVAFLKMALPVSSG